MIISKNTVKKLLKNNDARCEGMTYSHATNKTHWIITNTLKQRTDHVFYGYGDLRNSAETLEQFIGTGA